MLDNEVLKRKIKGELKALNLDKDQEDIVVKELNYLSDLLVEVYMRETQRSM